MSKYKTYNNEQLEELFANFLINSWSFSSATSFARNEKAFEKNHIYNERSRKSAGTVAGNAYHEALAFYFQNIQQSIPTTVTTMEQIAFLYIDSITADKWKIQKETPSIEACVIKATKIATSLIKNFFDDIEIYIEEIDEVLGVELRANEWITLNGVEIPLPCHAVVDLVIRLKNGKIVIVDHKSKKAYTGDDELAYVGGKQAITYVLTLESKMDIKVDEVWYVENKYSQNKDKSPQLRKCVIDLDKNKRMLYESMLYENVKRMLEAVQDPDYVYLINDSDSFEDKTELYLFWVKTLIAEVEDFNILPDKKEMISKRLKKIRDASIASVNPKVISEFRKNASTFISYNLDNMNMTSPEKIEHILRSFGIKTIVPHNIEGYSSDTLLVETGVGVQISSIMKHRLDIANILDVSNVRISKDLTVYNGKSYLSIEVSKKRTKDLLFDPKFLKEEKIPIGVDNFGNTIIWNLNSQSTPHMLICGATGSGKTVSILSTIEYAKLVGINDIVIFDPKYEFTNYSTQDIRVYNDIEDIEHQMKLLVDEMQDRAKKGIKEPKKLIIFDEFADAVASSRSGKDLDIKELVEVGVYKNGTPKTQMKITGKIKSLEENLGMILQKGRSLGFRVIAATQRASVKVITGDSKVNFPVQICFRVPKEIDSKVVLDESGAETLAGMGDGLMRSPEYPGIVRFQGFYKPN